MNETRHDSFGSTTVFKEFAFASTPGGETSKGDQTDSGNGEGNSLILGVVLGVMLGALVLIIVLVIVIVCAIYWKRQHGIATLTSAGNPIAFHKQIVTSVICFHMTNHYYPRACT